MKPPSRENHQTPRIVKLTIVYDSLGLKLWQSLSARTPNDALVPGIPYSRWARSPGGQLLDAEAYRHQAVVQGELLKSSERS